ncbi:hypothetical protein H9P43_005546 [Blastocladiella emersonii ATCC 22665]|nr:hypothetical protein H9P43_005546 [Blastocladiella emersonii ATCC 22665]
MTQQANADLLKSVKAELKAWEREFQAENGRKATKEDVFKDKDIFELYKLLSKLKAQSAAPEAEPADKPSPATERRPEPAAAAIGTADPAPATATIPTAASEDSTTTDAAAAAPAEETPAAAAATPTARPGTAGSVSRSEAIRKHQAARKRPTANVGRVVQSSTTTDVPAIPVPSSPASSALPTLPDLPPLSLGGLSLTRPGSSPTSPIEIHDDDVAHPQAVHLVAPELSQSEADALHQQPAPADDDTSAPQPKYNAFSKERSTGNLAASGAEGGSGSSIPTITATKPSGDLIPDPEAFAEDGTGMLLHRRAYTFSSTDEAQAIAETNASVEVDGPAVLKAAGVVPLATGVDIFKPPPLNEVMRGQVTRGKVPSRPNQTAFLLRNDVDGVVVASARREPSLKMKPTYYVFEHSTPNESPRESAVWKIKGNFEGSTFRILDNRTGDLLGMVHYTSACVPRSMFIVTGTSGGGAITPAQEAALVGSNFQWPFAHPESGSLAVFRNKLPKFNETLKTFCLNFHGRVTMPSVKNFQAVQVPATGSPATEAGGADGPVRLQFGRVARDAFNLDVYHPLPVAMAFAVALTTFDAIEKV